MDRAPTIGRPLFQSGKLLVSSSMQIPSVTLNQAWNSFTVRGIPCIYMRLLGAPKENSPYLTITIDTIYDVVEWLNAILDWFYNPKYKGLFYENEYGEVCLNLDAKDLKMDLYRSEKDNTGLRAYPAIVKPSPIDSPTRGITMIINRTENAVPLDVKSIRRLLSIFFKFSFQEEATYLIQQLMYAQMTHSVQIEQPKVGNFNAFKQN